MSDRSENWERDQSMIDRGTDQWPILSQVLLTVQSLPVHYIDNMMIQICALWIIGSLSFSFPCFWDHSFSLSRGFSATCVPQTYQTKSPWMLRAESTLASFLFVSFYLQAYSHEPLSMNFHRWASSHEHAPMILLPTTDLRWMVKIHSHSHHMV